MRRRENILNRKNKKLHAVANAKRVVVQIVKSEVLLPDRYIKILSKVDIQDMNNSKISLIYEGLQQMSDNTNKYQYVKNIYNL